MTRGFTLLEVMAATLLIALMASFFYAPEALSRVRELRRAQADVVADELDRVALAAQDWTLDHGGAWPASDSDCAFLFEVLRGGGALFGFDDAVAPRSSFYRAGARALPFRNPLWSEGELGRYYAWCDAERLQLEMFFAPGDLRWAEYIANRLAGTTVARLGEAHGGAVRLRAQWPQPAAIPLFDGLVSSAAPEFTGPLVGNLDAGGNAIVRAGDVVLTDGHSLGKTVIYAATVAPGTRIPPPRCAPGLEPQALLSFNRLLHADGRPIHYAEVYLRERVLAGERVWQFNSKVQDTRNVLEFNNSKIRINVIIRCA